MEIADVFLVFGEKITELEAAGCHAFFSYSGHVKCWDFYVFNGAWSADGERAISEYCSFHSNLGAFVQTCLNQSNLLILKRS